MPIRLIGARCPRRGCHRPAWKDGLCARCWRLAYLFGHEPEVFAFQPLDGWRDERDTISIDWDRFDRDRRF